MRGPAEATPGARAVPRSRQIAVIGAGSCEQGSEVWGLAEEVGRLIASEGCVLVCGGLGGVMEAASKGASEGGGTVIGVSPSNDPAHANAHCTHVVATGIGHARNLAVVASGEAVIAVGGAWGTLSEIGFARAMGRTVITLRSWSAMGQGDLADAPGVEAATTPADAVRLALAAI